MRVQVQPLLCRGEFRPASVLRAEAPKTGELSICDSKDYKTGVVTAVAQLIDVKDPLKPALLPDLLEARLLQLKSGRMQITGTERVGPTNYKQTWDVEVVERA